MKRLGVIGIMILAFCGLAVAFYIAQHEASGTLRCSIQGLSGCNTVAASPYSYLFGIPLSEFGILFYSIVFVLAALEVVVFDRLLRRILQAAALVGVAASLYFIFVQVFLIHALCEYCLASAVITLLILIFASLIEPVVKRPEHAPPATIPPPHLLMPPTA